MYGIEEGYDSEGIPADRAKYLVEFFEEFLKYISSDKHKSPLDFFSWHSYESSKKSIYYARYVRKTLDEFGFGNTESILNEWNPDIKCRGSEEDAARILTMITYLHREPLDKLIYYDGQVNGSYNGLFDPVKIDVFPAYYTFYSFNELYKLKNEVSLVSDMTPLPAVAACDGKTGKILFANETEEDMEFDMEVSGDWAIKKFRVLNGCDGVLETNYENPNKIIIPSKKIAVAEFLK